MSLVCRRCNGAPEVIEQKGRGNVIRCPSCGISGSEKKALENAKAYIVESAGNDALETLQSSIKSIASRSKNITYKPSRLSKPKAPDFIFE